jgi:hypothetical protein
MASIKTKMVYGSGKDCPSLGGIPGEIDFLNCPCQHYDHCLQEAIVPVCIVCTGKHVCKLQPTQSCSLFIDERLGDASFECANAYSIVPLGVLPIVARCRNNILKCPKLDDKDCPQFVQRDHEAEHRGSQSRKNKKRATARMPTSLRYLKHRERHSGTS